MFKKIVLESKWFVEYWLVPFTAALLPSKLSLYYLKAIARVPFLYSEVLNVALENAKQRNLVTDERVWKLRFKVNQIMDITDVFLCLLRGDKYLAKHVVCNFDLEQIRDADVIFFPHYGSGFLFHKLMKTKDIHACCVMADLPTNWFCSPFFYLLLCRLRAYVLKKHSNTQIISPNDLLPIRKALQNKKVIMLTPDVPSRIGLKTYQIDTELGRLNLPANFFDLAAERKLRVTNITFGFDYASGKRYFESDGLYVGSAIEHAQRFATMLSSKVKQNSYLWTMLNVVNKLLF